MNVWIAGKNVMKPHYHLKNVFIMLNLKVFSDEDYAHAQKVWDVFEIRNLGEYHELYIQSDTLLLADVYENFRNMCLDTYELDPV